ncbi:hypothetical protein SLEP1_g17551 [Rubroshorea leprosula]|uniref:Uncharacterized protein n=1 Tax=Rubroshorea leprosula TaxID=152421 RepID=A0AAV5J072_9ROSI|nr:hypothetical protein SLEP1_g17551 [Rubroshorea leprosula]
MKPIFVCLVFCCLNLGCIAAAFFLNLCCFFSALF